MPDVESRGGLQNVNDGRDSRDSQSLFLSLLNENEMMQDNECRVTMIKPFVLSTEAADVYLNIDS